MCVCVCVCVDAGPVCERQLNVGLDVYVIRCLPLSPSSLCLSRCNKRLEMLKLHLSSLFNAQLHRRCLETTAPARLSG